VRVVSGLSYTIRQMRTPIFTRLEANCRPPVRARSRRLKSRMHFCAAMASAKSLIRKLYRQRRFARRRRAAAVLRFW
jgi:hypothetical protein